jgi:hypothetical protein
MTSRRRPPRPMRGRGVSYHMGRGSLLLPSSSLCWLAVKESLTELRRGEDWNNFLLGIYSGTRVESTVELPAKNLCRIRYDVYSIGSYM